MYIYIIYVIILVEKSAGIISVQCRVPEARNMSTFKDEEALYQNVKKKKSLLNIYKCVCDCVLEGMRAQIC